MDSHQSLLCLELQLFGGILFYLLVRADNWKSDKPRRFTIALGLTLLYAISDEVHQSFVPGRHARWYDVGFDMIGAWVVYWGYFKHHFFESFLAKKN